MGIKEETFYEGGPHIGDLIFHLFLSIFIVFIPLAVGSRSLEQSGCGTKLPIDGFP